MRSEPETGSGRELRRPADFELLPLGSRVLRVKKCVRKSEEIENEEVLAHNPQAGPQPTPRDTRTRHSQGS